MVANTTCSAGGFIGKIGSECSKNIKKAKDVVASGVRRIRGDERRKALRSIVFTAFYYDSDSSNDPAPKMANTDTDVEKRLRKDPNATTKLSQFEQVVSDLTNLPLPGNQESERWRFLRSVVSFNNAAYPEDNELALQTINRELKHEIAWRCLSICGENYTKKSNVFIQHMSEEQANNLFLKHSTQDEVL